MILFKQIETPRVFEIGEILLVERYYDTMSYKHTLIKTKFRLKNDRYNYVNNFTQVKKDTLRINRYVNRYWL